MISVLGNIFIHPLAELLGSTPVIHDEAISYMWYIITFSPFLLFSFLLSGLVRNDNRPKLAMFGLCVYVPIEHGDCRCSIGYRTWPHFQRFNYAAPFHIQARGFVLNEIQTEVAEHLLGLCTWLPVLYHGVYYWHYYLCI